MPSMSLYEVSVEGLELKSILTANDGELTPELEQRLDNFLRTGKEKIDAACMVVRTKRLSEEALDAEIQRLSERKKSFENDRKRLESRILGAVDAAFLGSVTVDAEFIADERDVVFSGPVGGLIDFGFDARGVPMIFSVANDI